MTKTPFTTTNRALAIALHAAGAAILEVQNVFTPKMLKDWGFATGLEAHNARKQGIVRFFIERVDRMEQLIAAYNEEANREDETVEIPDDVEDDIRAVKIVCHSQKIRRAIDAELKKPHSAWEFYEERPMSEAEKADLERRMDSARKTGDGFSMSIPGFKIVNAAASQQTRKRLGL